MLFSLRKARKWSARGQIFKSRDLATYPVTMPGHEAQDSLLAAALRYADEHPRIPVDFQAQGASTG